MNLEVTLAGKTFKNPVTTASGTFGSGAEYEQFVDLAALGAVTTKGVANVPWEGNPTPRVAETYGGMLNAVGLQNPGIDLFCKRDIPHLKEKGASIIVNVCGRHGTLPISCREHVQAAASSVQPDGYTSHHLSQN